MNKRIGILLIMAFVLLSIVDYLNMANTQEVMAEDVYNIMVNNLTITAIAGVVVFGVITIMNRKKNTQ